MDVSPSGYEPVVFCMYNRKLRTTAVGATKVEITAMKWVCGAYTKQMNYSATTEMRLVQR